MLDEKDLQAIARLMAEMEARMDQKLALRMDQKLAQQRQEIIDEVKVLMEADVMPKFDLLADGIKTIHEKMIPAEAMDDIEDRLDVLETTVQFHAKELAKLKKAQ